MAYGTPVIATGQCALPEFIDASTGILLTIETDDLGEWKHIGRADRDTQSYEALFRTEIDRLAADALDRIEAVAAGGGYEALRANAHARALALFGAEAAKGYWDNLYDEAVS